jgi:SAM-dependent methyltransferase
MTTAPGRYALNNAHPGAPAMHECLSGILDENTIDVLGDYLQIAEGTLLTGTRTLVLGAGDGSLALWLANEITLGPIAVLDMDTSRMRVDVRNHPRVELLACDLLSEPLPRGPWDLVHARLLFAHLPNRRALLHDIKGNLAAGGVVMIEDWGVAGPGRVLHAPNARTKYLYQKYQKALISVFAAADNDPEWAPRVNSEMREAGLVNVRTYARAESWTGGSPGCHLPIAVSIELQDRLVQHGITTQDLVDLRDDLADPAVVLVGNLTWSTIGSMPRAGG